LGILYFPVNLRVTDTKGRPVDANIVDNGNGTYAVSYKPVSSGNHHVDIALAGSSIEKSPRTVPVTQDKKFLLFLSADSILMLRILVIFTLKLYGFYILLK